MRMAWSDWGPLIQEFVNHWTAFGAGYHAAKADPPAQSTAGDGGAGRCGSAVRLAHRPRPPVQAPRRIRPPDMPPGWNATFGPGLSR